MDLDSYADSVVTSVYSETLRMFPPVCCSELRSSRYFWAACLRQVQISNIPKSSAENTTFNVTDVNGTKRTVSVPQGIAVTLDVAGTHYNRKILVGAVESAILINDL